MRELLTKNPFTIPWVLLVCMFVITEGLAIWSNVPRATLSSHIRDWLRAGGWPRVALFAVFFAWLIPHLLWGLRK